MTKKLEVIKINNNGKSLKTISPEFGVNETSVGEWTQQQISKRKFFQR